MIQTEIKKTIEDVNENQWNNIVKQSKIGSVFHRVGWLKSLEKGLDLNPFHVIVKKKKNPVGIFPNFSEKVTKTPFERLMSVNLGSGGPVIVSDEEKVFEEMLEKSRDICKENNFVNHKIKVSDVEYVRYGNLFFQNKYHSHLRNCEFELALNGKYKELKKNFSKDLRYNLRKVEREKFEIEKIKYDSNTSVFFDLYKKVMIDRLDVKPLSRSFFISLANNFCRKVELFIAKDIEKEKNVGVFFLIKDEKKSILHHFFGAVLNEYLSEHITDLLHEKVIRWAFDNDYKTYNLGGNPSSFKHSLFKYKSQWGKLSPNFIWEKDFSTLRGKLFKFSKKIYRFISRNFGGGT